MVCFQEKVKGVRTIQDIRGDMTQNISCDILIVGGTAGGTAAALAAAGAGTHVCLLEETDWLGGQLTTQGVCTPDEQRHIETFGGTRRYNAFRTAVRAHYRTHYRLSAEAAALPDAKFNPGNCWVSRLAYEPKIGQQILQEMARPFVEAGNLKLVFRTHAVACEMNTTDSARIAAVIAEDADGIRTRFAARYVLDATDLGDLLPLCGEQGIDWTVGAESRAETGEPDAPESPRPDWIQPLTFPFALEWSPDTIETNLIEPPEDYTALKASQNYQIMNGAITGTFIGSAPWWSYRRLLAKANFDDPHIPNDVAMINTAGNDYYGGNIIGALAGSASDIKATLARARRASLGYVHWLQTECPREENAALPTSPSTSPSSVGYPEFRLRCDLFDTPDGCSIRPYIRESRRIRSLRPILEQEIVVKDFSGGICRGENARAAFMPDTVGIGHYALDIHPNGHGEPNAYVATRPFQIPLGALIPVRLTNLLPACKNLGVTHLTNGAYRLHPIEWNIGESAGLLAVHCLRRNILPGQVYENETERRGFQSLLLINGIALHWYIDVPPTRPAFDAVQKLAGYGIPPGSETDLLFRPDDPISSEDWQIWRELIMPSGLSKSPESFAQDTFTGTRADAALRLFP